jgi:two-component system, cell cycle sensor histidine kinase and response regulator CckA
MSVGTQILLLTFIVAIPAAGIIVYSGIQMREEAIHDASTDTQRLADNIAAEQQNLINAAQQLITALALLPDVKKQNRDRIQPILRDILKLNAQYSNILISDRSGLVWATAVPTKPPYIVTDRRYFKNVVASGQLSSGEYVISRATTRPAFNVASPLRNEHGAIIGVISVGFVLDAFKYVLERAKLPTGTNFVLLDHKGIVLYRAIDPEKNIGKPYDPEQFKQMQEGPDVYTFSDITANGNKRILSYRKLRLPDEQSPYMYICAAIPIAAVLVDVNKMLVRNLVLFTSFLALAVFFAWFVGKRSIADRVTLLEKASRDLAEGDLHVRVSDVVSGGELGRLGQTFDAMASQLALREQALVESERNYRDIFNTTTNAIFVQDTESGNIIETNKTVEKLFGYSREEILQRTVQDLSSGESPYSLQEALEWIHKTVVEGPQHFEWLSKRKNGTLFWTEVVLSATQIGGAGRVLAVVQDITERKMTEEALRESEERYRRLVDYSPLSIAVHSQGMFTYINQAGANLLGAGSPLDFIGRPIMDIVPPENREHVNQRVRQTQEQSKQTSLKEQDLLRLDGRRITVEMTGIPITYRGEPATQIVIMDITERRHAQEERQKLHHQLLQSQKMESVGQLAGGIAHDFNNILAAIVGYGNILQMKMQTDDPLRSYINQILAAAERAANLTQSLLAFSRKQVISPKDIDLNESIRKVEKFLTRIIGEDIALSTSLSDAALIIFIDPSQIEQVLMNLATNARDAMPKGGKLMIETGMVMLDAEYVQSQGFGLPGDYAVLTVSDTGEGMDEQTRQKIFEPFFTTKELGRGTGLGLAIVYGIVKQNNGFINVYSEPGKGTTFKLYLPFVGVRAGEVQYPEVQMPLRGGTETILLAEDNEIIRVLNKNVLEEFGYTVIEAVDGEEALQKFQEQWNRIGALILDVIMPKKNGREVFEEARRSCPNVKVLFMSGYPADLIQKEGVLERGLHFLSKPSSPQALLRTIREVLDQQRVDS